VHSSAAFCCTTALCFTFSSKDSFVTAGEPLRPEASLARLVGGEDVVHIADVSDTDEYRNRVPVRVRLVEQEGGRTTLWVALRKDENLLGAFITWRKEVRPFSEKEIALMQNFAAQAVIAIENARLLTEQREALEQQTATAEVLQVINANPGNLTPVFDAMLEKALHLCDAASGLLLTLDGDLAHVCASRDVPDKFLDYLKREPPGAGPNTFFGRSVLTRSMIHSSDIAAEAPYKRGVPLPVAAVHTRRHSDSTFCAAG
jgi:hypothetical protein